MSGKNLAGKGTSSPKVYDGRQAETTAKLEILIMVKCQTRLISHVRRVQVHQNELTAELLFLAVLVHTEQSSRNFCSSGGIGGLNSFAGHAQS